MEKTSRPGTPKKRGYFQYLFLPFRPIKAYKDLVILYEAAVKEKGNKGCCNTKRQQADRMQNVVSCPQRLKALGWINRLIPAAPSCPPARFTWMVFL